MKRIFTTVVLCLLGFSLMAQLPVERLIHPHILPASEDLETELYMKAIRDQIKRKNAGGLTGGAADISLEYYIMEQVLPSGEWENDVKETYKYDALGNVIENNNFYMPENSWEPLTERLYQYDVNGLPVEVVWKSHFTGAWENSLKIIFSYDANDRLQEEVHLLWTDTSWEITNKHIMEYDVNGKLSKTTYYDLNGHAMDETAVFEYSYAPAGELTTEIHSRWDGTDWSKTKFEHSYNLQGYKTRT